MKNVESVASIVINNFSLTLDRPIECPCCQGTGEKIIYKGFPLKSCTQCDYVWGIWDFITLLFNEEDITYLAYTGSYFLALYFFLFKMDADE